MTAMLTTGTGCAGHVVIEPGGDGALGDAAMDVDHGDAQFCNNDAGLNSGYCLPGYHCELYQGMSYLWNVCCPADEDGGGLECQAPNH